MSKHNRIKEMRRVLENICKGEFSCLNWKKKLDINIVNALFVLAAEMDRALHD